MRQQVMIVLLLLPVWVFGQQKEKAGRPQFQTSAGFGILAGENDPAWQWQIVNGLKVNNWFAGIGAGIDDYRFKTIPLFITARRDDLFRTALFGYADAGVALPWNRELQNDEGFFSEQVKFYTGFYSETGIGYRFPSQKRFAVQLSAGYSFRTIKQKVVTPMLWSSFWPTPTTEMIKHHRFHLLTVRTAVVFNHRK